MGDLSAENSCREAARRGSQLRLSYKCSDVTLGAAPVSRNARVVILLGSIFEVNIIRGVTSRDHSVVSMDWSFETGWFEDALFANKVSQPLGSRDDGRLIHPKTINSHRGDEGSFALTCFDFRHRVVHDIAFAVIWSFSASGVTLRTPPFV